jgi:hypothetical protein
MRHRPIPQGRPARRSRRGVAVPAKVMLLTIGITADMDPTLVIRSRRADTSIVIHDDLGFSFNAVDRVVHGLYQAGSALDPIELFELGFDAVYDLGGWERAEHMDGQAYRFYLIDDVPWISDPTQIDAMAVEMAALVRAGRRVVVNCSAGLNRSGLLVGRTLIELGHAPAEAVALVRSARGPHALSNVAFTKFLLIDRTPRRLALRDHGVSDQRSTATANPPRSEAGV